MRRSYKFLLRPTAKQQAALAAMVVEDHRQLYNAALEHRKTAYQRAGGDGPVRRAVRRSQAHPPR